MCPSGIPTNPVEQVLALAEMSRTALIAGQQLCGTFCLPELEARDLCVVFAQAHEQYIKKYPETRRGVAGGMARQNIARVRPVAHAFYTCLAYTTGMHPRTVQRFIRLGQKALKGSAPKIQRSGLVTAAYRSAAQAKDTIIREARVQQGVLEQEWFAAEEKLQMVECEWLAAEDKLDNFARERDAINARLQQQVHFTEQLQSAFTNVDVQHRDFPDLTRDLLRTMLAGRQTPEDVLKLLVLAYPDRVLVLKSAYDSAKKARNFRHTDRLLEILNKFVTLYYNALVDGRGDVEAYTYMGWSYAAKNGAQGKKFCYDGQGVTMERHLRIGTKESAAETLRVYFLFDAQKKKLVIGWCGEHL